MKQIGKSNFYRTKYGIGYRVNSAEQARKLNRIAICVIGSIVTLGIVLCLTLGRSV